MKKLKTTTYYTHNIRKWITLISILTLFLTIIFLSSSPAISPYFSFLTTPSSIFVEHKLTPPPPRLAYLISGSKHDSQMLIRVLLSIYHPNNRYIVHLDADSSPDERIQLFRFIDTHHLFSKFGNVKMISKANLVTYRGPTMVANTLHAAAVLLRDSGHWDWFINLSASDYPLVTQDDLLHTFSYLPRDLNFVHHTSKIGWKESKRAKPVIVDPGLYMTKKSDVFWITQRRSVPTAFKLFTATFMALLTYIPSSFKFGCWMLYKLYFHSSVHVCV